MAGTTRLVSIGALCLGLLVVGPRATALSPGASTVSGTVRDGLAAPVAGAVVRVCDPLPANTGCLPSVTTAADGTYTLSSLPDSVNMSFQVFGPSGGGLISHSNGLTLGASPLTQYDVTLQRGAVAGVVRGPGGVPVANVTVDLYPCLTVGACSGSGSAISGPDGSYAVGALQPTGTYRVGTNNGGIGGLFDAPDVTVSVTAGATTTQDLVLVAGGAVQGTVTDATTGLPIANAVIQTSAPSIFTSDVNGHYVSPPLKAGAYTIKVSPPSGSLLAPFEGPLTITSGVTSTLDVALAPGGMVTVHVLRADGTPYPSPGPFAVLCTSPATGLPCAGVRTASPDATGKAVFSVVPPGVWDVVSVVTTSPLVASNLVTITVTSGASLSCNFLGLTGTCGAPDDADGVSGATENAGPNGGDGNGDHILDSQQANVTSLPSAGAGAPYATIAGPAGSSLSNVIAIDPATLPPPPAGAQLPVGVLNFEVHGVANGAAVDVKIYLPTGTNPVTYLKNRSGVWSDFTASASFAGDVVTLHLVDGGAGDSDGVANGVIVDPGAPGVSSFGGFLAPIAGPPAVNSQKAGSNVPIKFSLGGNRGMNIFALGWPKSQTVPCGSSAPVNGTDSTETPGNSSLHYDAGSKTYSINWKTEKAWAGTCRQLVLKFADGSVARANFSFK